jgi:hypothetical protein
MNSKWMKFGMLAVALLVGMMLVASTASAQGPGGRGSRGGLGGPDDSLVAIAAKTLGIDQAALVSTLTSGKTIADVAKDKGVALDKIVDAVIAERAEHLTAAVAAGRMTQAQVDAMLARMRVMITAQLSAPFTPRGYGPGTGFVDANNDGVCDNCGMADGSGFAGRRGQRGGRW